MGGPAPVERTPARHSHGASRRAPAPCSPSPRVRRPGEPPPALPTVPLAPSRFDRQVDIFAVRQWAGNVADLDFACAIRAAPLFLLVAMHLPEVEALSQEDALAKKVPVSAKSKCAFYRVWVRRTARLAPSPPAPYSLGVDPSVRSCLARRPEQRADARACLSPWRSASSS